METYGKNYSEERFWRKLRRVAGKLSYEVLEKVLLLFFALPKAPARQRAVILGALGYFISPADAVPDVVPVAGFLDDAIALAWALKVVVDCIDDDVREKARKALATLGLHPDPTPA